MVGKAGIRGKKARPRKEMLLRKGARVLYCLPEAALCALACGSVRMAGLQGAYLQGALIVCALLCSAARGAHFAAAARARAGQIKALGARDSARYAECEQPQIWAFALCAAGLLAALSWRAAGLMCLLYALCRLSLCLGARRALRGEPIDLMRDRRRAGARLIFPAPMRALAGRTPLALRMAARGAMFDKRRSLLLLACAALMTAALVACCALPFAAYWLPAAQQALPQSALARENRLLLGDDETKKDLQIAVSEDAPIYGALVSQKLWEEYGLQPGDALPVASGEKRLTVVARRPMAEYARRLLILSPAYYLEVFGVEFPGGDVQTERETRALLSALAPRTIYCCVCALLCALAAGGAAARLALARCAEVRGVARCLRAMGMQKRALTLSLAGDALLTGLLGWLLGLCLSPVAYAGIVRACETVSAMPGRALPLAGLAVGGLAALALVAVCALLPARGSVLKMEDNA